MLSSHLCLPTQQGQQGGYGYGGYNQRQ